MRLPAEFRFDVPEVYIRRDLATGDVILSRRPASWAEIFRGLDEAGIPEDFLTERDQGPPQERPDA